MSSFFEFRLFAPQVTIALTFSFANIAASILDIHTCLLASKPSLSLFLDPPEVDTGVREAKHLSRHVLDLQGYQILHGSL